MRLALGLAALLAGVATMWWGASPAAAGAVDAPSGWVAQDSPTDSNLEAVACGPAGEMCVAVGAGGTLVTSRHGEETWTVQDTPADTHLRGVSCASPWHCAAVGDGGTIVVTSDGGDTWTSQDAGTDARLYDVACPAEQRCLAVGDEDPGNRTSPAVIVATDDGEGTWTPQKAESGELTGLSCPDPAHCLAVGREAASEATGGTGLILATSDGGETWTAQDAGDVGVFSDVSCPDARHCRGTTGSVVVVTDDGGGVWESTAPEAGRDWNVAGPAISCPDATHCRTVNVGGVWRSDEGGRRPWRHERTRGEPPDGQLRGVWVTGPDRGVAVGDDGTIVATPVPVPTERWQGQASGLAGTGMVLTGVSCPGEAHCTAVGLHGLILATGDGGQSWRVQRRPRLDRVARGFSGQELLSVSCPSVTRCVAVGRQGMIVVTDNGGASWQQRVSGVGGPLATVSCADTNHCLAVGRSQRVTGQRAVVITEDGGQSWHRPANPVEEDYNRLPSFEVSCAESPAGSATPMHCQAVGQLLPDSLSDGGIYGSKDGGRTWTAELDKLPDRPYAVSCVDARVCYAAGEAGVRWKTVTGGAAWTRHANPDNLFDESLYGIDCSDAERCAAVGGHVGSYDYKQASTDPGAILVTADGGSSWQRRESGTRAPLLDVSCPSPQSCTAVGHGGTIVATTDGGQTWARQHAGNLADVAVTGPETAYAVGAGGTIVATTDGGENWTGQDSTTAVDLNGVTFTEGPECPAGLPACHGWAVGHAGTILHTSDGGATWSAQDPPTQADLTDIACVDAQRCWATGRTAKSGGFLDPDDPAQEATIVATTDGGKTWVQQHEPDHDLFAIDCPTEETCYAVGGVRNTTLVLATTTGGNSWQDRSPQLGQRNARMGLQGVDCANARACVAVGEDGLMVTTDKSDDSWTLRTSGVTDVDFASVNCSDAEHCRAVTHTRANPGDLGVGHPDWNDPLRPGGEVWATDDGGVSWSVQAQMRRYGLRGVGAASQDASVAWAVGDGGAIVSTLDTPPGGVDLSASQRDATTVELSWSAPADGAQPAQRYEVRQATSRLDGGEDIAAARVLCAPGECVTGEVAEVGDRVSFTVSELDPGTTYYWAVRAVDDAEQPGAWGTVSLALPEVSPGAVGDLAAEAISTSEIELRFSAVGSDGQRPPPVEEYVVKQAREPVNEAAAFQAATTLCDGVCAFEPGQVGEGLSLTVADLQPATTYHYAVKARDDAGELSGLSNPASATTLDDETAGGGENTENGEGVGDGSGAGAVGDGNGGATGDAPAGTEPAESQATHACPEGEVPPAGFDDVAADSVHRPAIDCVAWYGISLGTSPSTYTPTGVTTRAQMASFIARTMETAGADLGDPGEQGFADIAGNPHARRINQLAAAGVVQGTSETAYTPQAPVTRAQMASFLVRAYEHTTDTPLPQGQSGFTDTQGSVHRANIDKAHAVGWAFGLSRTDFAPTASVRRDQQASFLARMLDTLVGEGFATPPDQTTS